MHPIHWGDVFFIRSLDLLLFGMWWFCVLLLSLVSCCCLARPLFLSVGCLVVVCLRCLVHLTADWPGAWALGYLWLVLARLLSFVSLPPFVFFFFCCCCPGSLSSPVSFGGSGPGFLRSLLPPFLPTASCGVLSFCHRRLVAISLLLVAGRSHGLGCTAASKSGVPDVLSAGQSGAPLCSKDCVHGECSLRAFLSPMPLTHGVVKVYGLRTLLTWVA